MPWVNLQQGTALKGAVIPVTTPVVANKSYVLERQFAGGQPPGLWMVWRRGYLINLSGASSPLTFTELEFQFCYTSLVNYQTIGRSQVPQAFQLYMPLESRFNEVSYKLYRFD